jgi:hypothetical protein
MAKSQYNANALQQTRANLQRVRRDGRLGNTTEVGYLDQGSESRAVQGDDDAPWIKLPPFPSEPQGYGEKAYTLPTSHAVPEAFLPAINVENVRRLTLLVDYKPGAVGGILSLIPYFDGYPQIAQAAPVSLQPPGEVENFDSVTVRPLEYRTGAALQTTTALELALTFDVSNCQVFFLTACDVNGTPGHVTFQIVLAA